MSTSIYIRSPYNFCMIMEDMSENKFYIALNKIDKDHILHLIDLDCRNICTFFKYGLMYSDLYKLDRAYKDLELFRDKNPENMRIYINPVAYSKTKVSPKIYFEVAYEYTMTDSSINDIAKKYYMSPSSITNIIHNISWANFHAFMKVTEYKDIYDVLNIQYQYAADIDDNIDTINFSNFRKNIPTPFWNRLVDWIKDEYKVEFLNCTNIEKFIGIIKLNSATEGKLLNRRGVGYKGLTALFDSILLYYPNIDSEESKSLLESLVDRNKYREIMLNLISIYIYDDVKSTIYDQAEYENNILGIIKFTLYDQKCMLEISSTGQISKYNVYMKSGINFSQFLIEHNLLFGEVMELIAKNECLKDININYNYI